MVVFANATPNILRARRASQRPIRKTRMAAPTLSANWISWYSSSGIEFSSKSICHHAHATGRVRRGAAGMDRAMSLGGGLG